MSPANTQLERPDTVSRRHGATAAEPPEPTVRPGSSRNVPLDFIKGFLVIGMIIYHAVNYFALDLWPLLVYIKFVSGGFIFISGYTVATFYAAKWAADPLGIASRLSLRGLKLVALFTIINLAVSALSIRNFTTIQFGLEQFANRAFDIFIIGSGKYVAFEILLPIGYLLLLSPIVLWLQKWRMILIGLLVLIVASTLFLHWHLNNVALLLVGAAGMMVGLFLPPERIACRRHLLVSVPALLLVVAALPWLRLSLSGYILYIVVVCKCVADLSLLLPARWPARRMILFCGEYVLFCYLTQILILQVIFRLAWPHRESPVLVVALIVVVTGFLMLLAARAMASARQRFSSVDRAYRFVFA